MRILFSLITLSLLLVSACATIPTKDITIDTDADQQVAFSKYKSYQWLASAGIMSDPDGKWEPPGVDVDAEITFLIDRELRKRGMTETSMKPDLYVAYVLGVDMEALKLKENPETKISTLKNVPGGALLLVLIDAQSTDAVWAGLATAELQQGMDMETRKKRLDYVVTNMLKQLPAE
jgi:hypothetical protein